MAVNAEPRTVETRQSREPRLGKGRPEMGRLFRVTCSGE